MNHLFQQMRHTGKTATGYKVQLAVHRMSAQLPASYAGVEMCAVITRHKKRVVTKCACYAADKKEIVWGDILPFTCTLYLAKTGLYQPKLFTVQIFDTRTDSLVATFEFNLSEHVQSNRDASKESIMVPTVKCHDSRASLSLTIVASKATSRATRPAGEPEGSLADEVSFDGSRSDMSVITLDSKSSRASMSSSRHGRQHGSMTSPHGDSKSDVLRGANPANDASDPIEMYGLRCKNQELHKAVQDLEEQLRQRDSDNAKLEKKVTEKDQAIQKLQAEKDELEQQLVETEYRGGTPGDSAQRGESLRYTKLKEEKQELLKEVDELRQTLRDRAVIPPPLKVTVNKFDQGEGGEKSKDSDDSDSDSDSDDDEQHEQEEEKEEEPREAKRSEVSSVNEYVDAHETQLIAEINELKQTLHTVKSENQQQRSAIADLTKLKDQLTHQLQGLEGKVEMLESENDSQRRRLEEQESELRRTNEVGDELDEIDRRRRAETTEVRDENEKLVQQLSHLDHIVTQLKEEKAALAAKLKQTESSQSRAQREMQDAQDAIGQLSGTNQAMNEQLEVAHEANTRARLEIESAQVTINELRDQVREISEKLQATQDELERVRDVELASSTAAAAAAIVKNQELQGRWDDLKVQNDQLQTRVEELEQKLAQTEASGEEREADLQRQVEELKQETVQLREELDELRASKLQAEEELRECTAALQQALENQQRLALDHEQQVTGLEMQKADARALIKQQLKEKEALEASMKNRVAELEKENDYFQGELIDSKMKLAELMVKNEELSSQYHRVEKNLNELKAKAAEAAAAAPPSKKNKKHRFDRRVERSETEPTWLDAASATARRPRKSLSTMEPACPPDSAFNSASNELLLTRQAPMYVEKMDTEMTTPRDDDDDAHERLLLLSAAAHAQEPAVDEEDHTASESAPLRRVRELLREMLTAGAWGERDHEDWERRKLQELRECVLDEAALESLQKLPKRMCAYEFKPGDIAWNCKVCQVDETCVMCNDCFISSDHENHEVFFYYTHSGGCCDCGDTEAWASDGFCTQHRGAHDVDPLVYFPPELLASARACLGEVLSLILHTITEARAMPVIDTSDVDRVRAKLAFEPADQRYSVLVHFNEMQSSQEFATALTRALPAISYQTLKIVGEATSQKQSVIRSRATREEAIDVVDAMCRHGLVTSIVSSDYKAKTPVVSTLLQWVVSMANLSDGFCRLVCEQFIAHTYESTLADESSQDLDGKQYEDEFPVLRAVILADSFLPKHGSDALHSLLMALLADPVFKKAFAVAFTRCYRQLYREFFVGVGSSSVTILTFSVQFFNRASFVKLLVLDHELLEVLVVSVLETLRRKPRRLPLLPPDSPVDESSSLLEVLTPYFASSSSRTVKQWDLLAFGIQRTIAKGLTTLYDVDVPALEAEAARQGLVVLKNADTSDGTSVFATLPLSTELPGRFELDVASPVFVYRRYMSGLLDLRYALQIEGISELFVLEKNGARLAGFLLYLSYIQGVCPEVRRFGDHVEVESRAWVVTVEFVSTATDVFTWIIANVFKHVSDDVANDSQLRPLIAKLTHTIMEAYYFWLASTGKYFPSSDFQMGKPLTAHPVDVAVSCHFPLHRALAQFIRTLCDSPRGLEIFYELINNSDGNAVETSPWVHGPDHSIGFWHRVNLIEPVLQAIVWDAEVHSGLWVRNGLSVLNHSMNYGEPPFCLRFRDLDLLVVQFGFQLLGIEWMMNSVMNRFGAADWLLVENSDSRDAELMVSECLVLLCQFASELPPRVVPEDPLRSLMVFLRREIVQRLIVGPCAHSDLTKTATDFFGAHENLFASKFSTAPLLDQIIKEICVDTTGTSNWATSMGDTSSNSGGGKVQYRLKPELFAEYQPTFVHSTRKQHEAAHENWFQHRLRVSKAKEQQQDDVATAVDATQSTWLDFPLVKNVLPCASGFRSARLSILHAHARRLVYETLWKASTDARSSLNLLSRAVHLFTVQVYVLEEVRYKLTILATSDADELYREEATRLVDEFTSWLTTEQLPLNADPNNQSPRTSVIGLLLKLDPWLPGNGTSTMVNLDGDQKHEIGRGVDWLVHRLARLDGECEKIVEQHRMTRHASKEEEDRKALLIKRRREAQMRAIQQMQQRQAAFAFQMQMMTEAENDEEDAAANDAEASDRVSIVPVAEGRASIAADIPMEDFGDGEVSLPECAMCHSTESENSFMCYVGFAQCSPVFSRVNGDKGRYLSTPMDEMHLGEDVPVHVRLCGHSVHHTCWESYHASQFQRAITGGHHRHALNAVDVTKKEFLCPLCKSISNVLIPTTTDELNQCLDQRIVSDETVPSHGDLMVWLESVGRANLRDSDEIMEEEDQEQKTERPVAAQLEVVAPAAVELSPRVRAWLEDGLSSLCMAIHKVACGATQKSRPDRYTASGCLALFHTLLCTFLGSPERDQLRPEQRFLEAMRFVPLMLQQVTKPPRTANGTPAAPFSAVATPRRQLSHLLYYGGSEILPDGTIVLEDQHPSTQTQTRKQSQWGKVRWPMKPLLLSQLGSLLVKGILLAESEQEAIIYGRLVVLARLVQTLLWFSITRHEDYTDKMADELEPSEKSMQFFVATMFDEPNRSNAAAAQFVEQLRVQVLEQCGAMVGVSSVIDDPHKLLNIVATEVVPMLKVTTFLLKARFNPQRFTSKLAMKPVFVNEQDVHSYGFVRVDSLWAQSADLQPVVGRWVQRFKAAYDEMNDPQGVLAQWFSTANMDKAVDAKLDYARVLARDLNTVHTSMSVYASGSNRMRYLRALPRAYVKFYAALAKRKCAACNQFPARPAVCLCCGLLLCAASTCPSIHHDKGYPEESNPGACTVHAKKCGRGSCMFLLVLEGAVLLVYWKLAAYVGSLYVDEYGEEFGERNRELSKGRPLFLNAERRDRLLRLWMHHEIPNEVVRIQNSSDRVIRNSHY